MLSIDLQNCKVGFVLVMISISHKWYFMVDVHSADGAAFVGLQPLIHAFGVKQMHARKPANIFAFLKVAQTNRAFVRRFVVVWFSVKEKKKELPPSSSPNDSAKFSCHYG